ncbi:hypothetical protein [Aeromicrobium sp.]|uniref:hypothetical protein n=1 Tax=Aeromicrobium sp. TaxID=1871063 RepID=UPI0030BBEE8F
MARLQIVGDEVRADLRGMPPVVRHMLRDQFAALELMTAEQIRDYLSRDTVGRIERVETVLTEAGR